MKKVTAILLCGLLAGFLFTFSFNKPAFACDYSRGTITSVAPQTISTGDILTITGNGFGTLTSGQNEVHFIFFEPPSTTRHGGGSFGGGLNGGTENYLSWSNTEIQIRIPDDFETRYGGVMNALNQNINKFHPYVIIRDDNGKEVCGSPIDSVNSTFYYQPSCNADTWSCGEYQACTSNNQQTRTCTKTFNCPLVDTLSPSTTQSCTYVPTTCTSWNYSNWSSCSESGQQTRSVTSSSPENCTGGNPVLSQSCTYTTPTITSITNSINSVNDTVTITGQGLNFSSTLPGYGPDNPSQNTLYCNGTNMWEKIISWTGTSIQFTFGNASFFTSGNKANCYISFQGFYAPGESTDTNYNSNSVKVTLIPTCTSWTYSDWGICSVNGQQTRIISGSLPQNCTGGNPILTQACTYTPSVSQGAQGSFELKIPEGRTNGVLNSDKIKIDYYGSDIITKLYLNSAEISLTVDQFNIISYGPPLINHQIVSFYPPTNSTSGNLIIHTASDKTKDVGYLKIATVQEIVPPTCTADIWECGIWNICSPSGIQSRSCSKTFDCPNVQTAPPSTDQFCEAPNRPQQTVPNQSEEIVNQSTIIKSTVKLFCPVDEKSASQGSGTIIDSAGTILTNKHVVAGTLGCLVGFINDFDDEPYFGERQIADIIKTSPTQDIAILKIRNPKNKSLSYVDTTRGVSNFSLGTKITTYGYPAKFGTKITYTSGDFSGTDASYLKTTAILEYGNSGGGAYLKNGTFIGVPSAVVKGELNALGYILSVNTINAWLSNSSIASNPSNNQFSRVSVLEKLDLKKLDTLNLFIPNSDEGSFPDVSKNHQNITAIKFLKERKIVNGYPDGTFKPENTVNRAELLTILVNAKIGKPNENQYKNCFPDVKTEWFAPYVCYAKNAGWVKGYPDGKYRPGQTVNKVEALTILLNSQSISTSSSLTSKPFNDVNTTDWFAKYVAKAKALEILEETGNMLSPGEGMKRAGVSEILYRLLIK